MRLNAMIAYDFLYKTVWTPANKKAAYLLVFIHRGSRNVYLHPSTHHPHGNRMRQQARNISMWTEEQGIDLKYLVHDHDSKFTKAFDQHFTGEDRHVIKTPIRTPVANVYAESWAASFKRECLNHFFCLSLRHLDHLAQIYARCYNELRPHQGIRNTPLTTLNQQQPESATGDVGRIVGVAGSVGCTAITSEKQLSPTGIRGRNDILEPRCEWLTSPHHDLRGGHEGIAAAGCRFLARHHQHP